MFDCPDCEGVLTSRVEDVLYHRIVNLVPVGVSIIERCSQFRGLDWGGGGGVSTI